MQFSPNETSALSELFTYSRVVKVNDTYLKHAVGLGVGNANDQIPTITTLLLSATTVTAANSRSTDSMGECWTKKQLVKHVNVLVVDTTAACLSMTLSS